MFGSQNGSVLPSDNGCCHSRVVPRSGGIGLIDSGLCESYGHLASAAHILPDQMGENTLLENVACSKAGTTNVTRPGRPVIVANVVEDVVRIRTTRSRQSSRHRSCLKRDLIFSAIANQFHPNQLD